MTDEHTPLVTIGLPVYNGSQYIDAAVQSIIDQDFTDFELVISDNASTDGTQEMLKRWASQDDRIRLTLNENNLGASENFNRVLKLARGRYFRWATHDDRLAPGMLSACVEALSNASDNCVLVYPQTIIINEKDEEVEILRDQVDLQQEDPIDRFREFIRRYAFANAIYGVMKTEVIMAVGGLPKYNAGDLTMIAGLALRGTFVELPQPLFYRRVHGDMSWKASRTAEGFARWFDPSRRWVVVFQAWRLWRELALEVWRSPLPLEVRLRGVALVGVAWPRREWKRMFKEVARVPLVLARTALTKLRDSTSD